MNLVPFTAPNSRRDEIGQFPGGSYRRPLFTSFDDASSNAPGESLFAEFKNDSGNFRFGKLLKKIGCGSSARRVHAHVQRSVKPKTETTFGGIELEGRNAEVYENPVGIAFACATQHVCQFAKVGLVSAKSFAKRSESLLRVSESRRVEVHPDDTSTLGGIENRFAVSAKANRAVNKETSSFRNEEHQCLF